MGLAYYVTLERPVPGVDGAAAPGRAAARNDRVLSELAQRLRVSELLDFRSPGGAELAEFLEQSGASRDDFDLPDEAWFDAYAGLETVQVLLEHVRAHPDEVQQPVELLRDLEGFEQTLRAAVRAGVRWHLTIDF
ncbi:MAG TPA: hypothetical protein RMG48_07950 [Myxococcales bacterium LLY-WYZ-16_1]|jgi:hypothetical protein|nr:hypothetical protein [Myxococcales bacterium LLY-WYZ-16_1]